MADEQPRQIVRPEVPIEAIQIIDPQVLKELRARVPRIEKFESVSIGGHGKSLWTRTARICTHFVRNHALDTKVFFLKITYGATGKEMVESEFECMDKLHDFGRDFVTEPFATGTYSSMPDVHFLLCEFRPMEDKLPPPFVLGPKVAVLHRSSPAFPKFGFYFATFHGNVRVVHPFSKTWEEYFTTTTRALFEQERSVQGPSEEIEQMIEPFFQKVIPRLLRPLETGGRSITPCIIHGDLWHGNVGIEKGTGKSVIFDAASFFAHNEYELGVWRQPWNKINSDYRDEYHKHFPPSDPVEDCDDRNALYAIRVNLLDSILYKNEELYRKLLIPGMRDLVKKFPGGFEEWEASRGSSQA
ncbi:Fructosamine kinase-domain-containing protein [Hypoxylon rubiginosum]|uniref:Fructosamine kinase-domain-containing protein n=1 Tax=Hypoxylon rubiginosum TaxID=110542 RepID=A0ACB9YWT8_9PEZI|nr:Fructosamine kinase-domain-containing protein [Hypoxylon rubiginosum]